MSVHQTTSASARRLDARSQGGYTLVEVLVAMIIASIVLAGLVASIVAFSKSSAAAVGQQQKQGDVLDVLNTTSRQISYSDKILFASPTELSLMVVEGPENSTTCRRYTYKLIGTDLHRYTQDLKTPSCPALKADEIYSGSGKAPGLPASSRYALGTIPGKDEVVVSKIDLDALRVEGVGEPVLYTYYDTSSASLNPRAPLGANTADAEFDYSTDRISLVRTKLVSDVARRGAEAGSVTLETSAAPRSALPLNGTFPEDPTSSCPAGVVVKPATGGADAGIEVTWRALAGESLGYDVFINNALVKSAGQGVTRATLSKAEIESVLGANSYKAGSQYAISVRMKGAAPDATCTVRWYLPQVTSAAFTAVTLPGGLNNSASNAGSGNQSEEAARASGTSNVPAFINWSALPANKRQPAFSFSWTPPASGVDTVRGYQVVGRQVDEAGNPYGPVRALKGTTGFTDVGDDTAILPASATSARYEGTGTNAGNSLWGSRWTFQLITIPKNGTGDKLSPVETVRAQPKPVALVVDARANNSRDSVSNRIKTYYSNPVHWEVSRCKVPGGTTFVCADNYRVLRSDDGASTNLPNDRSGLVFGTGGRLNHYASELVFTDNLKDKNNGTAVGQQSQLGTDYRYGVLPYNAAGNGPIYTGPEGVNLTDTSLQAPPDVVAVNGTNTADSVDTPSWSAARRAASYEVFSSDVGGASARSAGTTSGTSKAVTPRIRAAQEQYSVVASNATGTSPYGQGPHQGRVLKTITQRPTAPRLEVYSNNSDATSVRVIWNRTSDIGKADRFCDTSPAGGCEYQLIQQVTTVIDPPVVCTKNPPALDGLNVDTGSTCIDPPPYTVVNDNTLYTGWAARAHTKVNVGSASQSYGSTYEYRVRARNLGTGVNSGWSDWARQSSAPTQAPPPPPPSTCEERGDCPPKPEPEPEPEPKCEDGAPGTCGSVGSFEIDGFEKDFPANAFRFNGRTDYYAVGSEETRQFTSGRVGWTDAPGAAYYTWSRTGGPLNVRTTESVTTWDGMEADKKYDYTVVAHGADGSNLGTVTRSAVVAAPPAHPRKVTAVQQCLASRNAGRFRTDWTVEITADRTPFVNGAVDTNIRKYERNANETGARQVGAITLPFGPNINPVYEDMTAPMRKGGGKNYSEGYWFMWNHTVRPAGEFPAQDNSYARGYGIFSGNDNAWEGQCATNDWDNAPMTPNNYPNSHPNVTIWDAS